METVLGLSQAFAGSSRSWSRVPVQPFVQIIVQAIEALLPETEGCVTGENVSHRRMVKKLQPKFAKIRFLGYRLNGVRAWPVEHRTASGSMPVSSAAFYFFQPPMQTNRERRWPAKHFMQNCLGSRSIFRNGIAGISPLSILACNGSRTAQSSSRCSPLARSLSGIT